MLITLKRMASSGLLVDVELGDRDLVAVLGGDLVEDRGDHLARPAPLGPEVDDDRLSDAQPTASSKVAVERCDDVLRPWWRRPFDWLIGCVYDGLNDRYATHAQRSQSRARCVGHAAGTRVAGIRGLEAA